MDCVPSRAQPASSGDHPWPQPQYGMEQNHLGHPNSSQQDDIRRYPGPFRKRDLSLRVPPRPPKKKVKLGLVINSSHHGVDRPAGELEEETQDLPEDTTLTEAMLAGHEGQTSRTRDRDSNSSYSFVRGPCLPGWAFRGRRLRFLDRSRSPLATLGGTAVGVLRSRLPPGFRSPRRSRALRPVGQCHCARPATPP